MTVTSGFFNSVNHDRLYDAEQVSSMFDGIIEDGVYENVGEAFMVTSYTNTNNTVIVGTGRAWFDHTWTVNDSQFSVTLSSPNTLLPRIDTIVIDVDRRDAVRQNAIEVMEGSYAEKPVPPSLFNDELHKQYPIANIYVAAGTDGVIPQSSITYLVGTESCPLVMCPLEAMNITNYFQQMQSEFEIWFEGIKDILNENVAQNLQNQIDELKNNQTVNEKGEIGNYAIPFTKEVMDAMVNGSNPVHVSSTNIKGYIFTEDDFAEPPMGGIGSYVDIYSTFPYSQAFLLPNGKICRCMMTLVQTSTYNDHYEFIVEVIDKNGTGQVFTSGRIGFKGLTGSTKFYVFGVSSTVTNIKADNYPVSFDYSFPYTIYTSSVPNTIKHGVWNVHVSISSDGLVSMTHDDNYANFYTDSEYTDIPDEAARYYVFPVFTNNDDVVWTCVWSIEGGEEAFVYPSKIDKNGLFTANAQHLRATSSGNNYPTVSGVVTLNGYQEYNVDTEVNVIHYRAQGYATSKQYNMFDVDPVTLAVTSTYSNSGSPFAFPSDYYLPSEGSIDHLENGGIIKRVTYNKRKQPTTETLDLVYNPIILYGGNSSVVNTANVFVNYDVGSTIVGVYINGGSNVRGALMGKNKIGIYLNGVPTSLPGSANMLTSRIVRNKYRIRDIDGHQFLLFDTYANPGKTDTIEAVDGEIPNDSNDPLTLLEIYYEE